MHIEYKKVLMKKIGIATGCILVFLIACEKISDYTIEQVDHPSLSISAHQESRIHELVYQIQSRNIEALKNSVTPELHEKIVTEPKYLEQLCSLLPEEKSLKNKELVSTSERILDRDDRSFEVLYKLSYPTDLVYLQIKFAKNNKRSLVDDIQISKVAKSKA